MVKTIYFLGAGVSKEAGAPTQQELWEKVILKWQGTGDKRIEELLDFAVYLNLGGSRRNISVDTAQFLTLIDLALEQNAALGRYSGDSLRKIRRHMIRAICHVLENNIKPGELDSFQKFCAKLSSDDIIITLNYDTVLDKIIKSYVGQVSYGFKFASVLGEDRINETKRKKLLLKPHGSLNWLFCNCCNNIYLVPDNENGFLLNDETCPFDENTLQEVIVTPSYNKRFIVPQLHDIWIRCFNQIKDAEVINFIGYSFSPGDIHIIYLLKRAILAGKKKPQINVVTPDPQGIVLDRCQKMFADFKYYKMSFNQYLTI